MTISIHEAQISTAAVEIKTITVRGKQVTQSLFRQLQEEAMPWPPPEMWGWVHYHPDKCSADSLHRHVVWQKGTELRRAKVSEPVGVGTPLYLPEAAAVVLSQSTLSDVNGWTRWGVDLPAWAAWRFSKESGDLGVRVDLPELVGPGGQVILTDLPRRLDADVVRAIDPTVARVTLIDAYAAAIQQRGAAIDMWKAVVGLDQLFIAT